LVELGGGGGGRTPVHQAMSVRATTIPDFETDAISPTVSLEPCFWYPICMGITWDGLSAVATPIGLLATVYQLGQTRRALRYAFERTFVDRYCRIASSIDVDVMLGTAAADLGNPETKRAFFDYFELCEEELYFRAHRKVGLSVWRDWWYGISTNLRNPNFEGAFESLVIKSAIGNAPHRFPHLREAFVQRNERTFEPNRSRRLDRRPIENANRA
jgi:hypothetical protein